VFKSDADLFAFAKTKLCVPAVCDILDHLALAKA